MKLKTVSTRGDHDPEDEYNLLDNPVLSKGNREKYRKHLSTGHTQPQRSTSKHQSALLEDAFKEGKYEGRVVSRSELGMIRHASDSDNIDEDYSYSDSDTISDNIRDANSKDHDSEMEQFAKEMRELKQQEHESLKLIQQQRVSDKTRGEHVRNQMSAWEALLEVEMRVHGLLEAVNKDALSEQPKTRVNKRLVKEINSIGKTLQSFANQHEWSEQRLWEEGREQLAKWHQQAIASTMTSVNKQGIASLARDPWTFVEEAWRTDRDRILKKSRRSVNTTTTTSYAYDDQDFHRQMLKEWTLFRSADGVAFLAIHQNNHRKPTEGRVSKGRRLCHDVQPKLLAYMMPVVDESRQWNDAKVDDLIKSLFRS